MVTDVVVVAAFELRHPVLRFVEMETRDASLGHSRRLTHERHARAHIPSVNRIPATYSVPKIRLVVPRRPQRQIDIEVVAPVMGVSGSDVR